MAYSPLTQASEIAAAYKKLRARLLPGTTSFPRQLGYQGGNESVAVHWRDKEKKWAHLGRLPASSRYWCCYGTQHPEEAQNLNVTVEINPVKRGVDRQTAGAFLKDSNGHLYLAHSGRVGGGRKGIGKTAFVRYYLGAKWVPVSWPDNTDTEMILVGEIEHPRFPAHVADFVHQVAKFKELAVSGKVSAAAPGRVASFTPESERTRRSYRIKGAMHSECDHPIVVRHLAQELERLGMPVANDGPRDLYIPSSSGDMRVLFEVKTDQTTSDLHMGIGQLMFNGAKQRPAPRRVLVVPGSLTRRVAGILNAIGIEVVSYSWQRGKPVFRDLGRALPPR